MRVIFILYVLLVLNSCEMKVTQKEYEPYIISKVPKDYQASVEKYKLDKNKRSLPPPPPPAVWGYGFENFIIDDSLNVFYYQFQPKGYESCLSSEEDYIPYFQGLKPDMLIQLPKENLIEFVKLNFKRRIWNKVKIASQRDTLNSIEYFDLVKAFDKYLNKNEDGDTYRIFASTQEEDTVLYYKKHKKKYDSDSIKWDKKRVRFFSKPKIDE